MILYKMLIVLALGRCNVSLHISIRLLSDLGWWFCCCRFIFYVPPIVYGASVFVFVLVCITFCPSSFAIILTGRESWLLSFYGFWIVLFFLVLQSSWQGRERERKRAVCFVFIVFWMYCYCKCLVVLPHSAVGGSADCGITWSYPLTFWMNKPKTVWLRKWYF